VAYDGGNSAKKGNDDEVIGQEVVMVTMPAREQHGLARDSRKSKQGRTQPDAVGQWWGAHGRGRDLVWHCSESSLLGDGLGNAQRRTAQGGGPPSPQRSGLQVAASVERQRVASKGLWHARWRWRAGRRGRVRLCLDDGCRGGARGV
jgi:hypothetical protein